MKFVLKKVYLQFFYEYFRGFATGIYATNTPEAVEFVAKHSEANVLVVENNQQLQKVLQIWDNLPSLKAVVQYTGEVAERRNGVYSVSKI